MLNLGLASAGFAGTDEGKDAKAAAASTGRLEVRDAGAKLKASIKQLDDKRYRVETETAPADPNKKSPRYSDGLSKGAGIAIIGGIAVAVVLIVVAASRD